MTSIFILLGILPSFAWLIFFLREDIHPEPRKMIVKTFIAGALITFATVFIQFFLQNCLSFLEIKNYDPISFLVMGIAEEVLKFLAAYLVIRNSRFFDEPVDAMIYMITAALGFAMVENIAVLYNISMISEALGITTLRFVGATLLHALSSGIVGYYWAKGLVPERLATGTIIKKMNWIFVFKGIVLASILHMFFNYLILINRDSLVIYPTIFLIIVALFVFWDFEKIKKA